MQELAGLSFLLIAPLTIYITRGSKIKMPDNLRYILQFALALVLVVSWVYMMATGHANDSGIGALASWVGLGISVFFAAERATKVSVNNSSKQEDNQQ